MFMPFSKETGDSLAERMFVLMSVLARIFTHLSVLAPFMGCMWAEFLQHGEAHQNTSPKICFGGGSCVLPRSCSPKLSRANKSGQSKTQVHKELCLVLPLLSCPSYSKSSIFMSLLKACKSCKIFFVWCWNHVSQPILPWSRFWGRKISSCTERQGGSSSWLQWCVSENPATLWGWHWGAGGERKNKNRCGSHSVQMKFLYSFTLTVIFFTIWLKLAEAARGICVWFQLPTST